MIKKVSFNQAKKVLGELTRKKGSKSPKYQVDAHVEFFNMILSKIEDGSCPSWFWPDAMTMFKKEGNMCVVDGPVAKLFHG